MPSRVQQKAKANKIWLPMHPRNFGSDNTDHPYIYSFALTEFITVFTVLLLWFKFLQFS